MRRGFFDADYIESRDKEVIGLCLGYDYVSEHECGISNLRKDFGINAENGSGFRARKNNIIPRGLVYFRDGSNAILAYSNFFSYNIGTSPEERVKHLMGGELRIPPDPDKSFGSAWDDDSFGINANSYDSREIVNELYEAINNKDCVVMLGGGGAFKNPGLCLMVYSKIPELDKDKFRKKDVRSREKYALMKRLERGSGVLRALEESGKKYFYLSVDRLEKGKPLWWLNPYDQDKYEAGWYTTDDLFDWANDKGKIIKNENE